jgi:benzoate-CoA ligase
MPELTAALTATELGISDEFNAATYFVDRNVREGRGDKVAIECGDERVTYQRVLENTNRVGSALRDDLGLRREERVVLLMLDGPEYAYSFFGSIKIGAIPIPLSTLLKAEEYRYIFNDSRARVAIVSASLLPQLQAIPADQLRHLREIVVVGEPLRETGTGYRVRLFSELLDRGSPSLEAELTSKDDAAFWLYSSGSTGFPKGCVHLQHDMAVCTELYAKGILHITEQDRCFSVAKLFFAYGLGNALYFPFAVGATTILMPGQPTASNVYSVIERYRPTLFFSVPTNYAMLLAHHAEGERDDFDLSSIRWGISAAESLPPAIFQRFTDRFGVTILDGIGSTEMCHIFISNQPGAVRPGSSGRPVPGYEAKLLDQDGQAVEQGEIGNLLVKGDSTCALYWNKHERTKDTIEGHWIRTGDRYRMDEDGFYWYAGRSDDMLKVGGIWVSPVEVENCLIEHSAVLECAVVACEDDDEMTKPLAYVVLHEGVVGTPELAEELQLHVRSRLAGYKRPRWVEFVSELPKTGTGKIQRFKLRDSVAVTSH